LSLLTFLIDPSDSQVREARDAVILTNDTQLWAFVPAALITNGQRGANGHASGMSIRSGGRPSIAGSRSEISPLMRGTERIRPRVYGCFGCRNSVLMLAR